MTRRVVGLVGVLVVLLGIPAGVAAQSDTSPLDGAWAAAGPGSGLVVFSGQHYSMTLITDVDRPDFVAAGGPETASANHLRAVWGPLIANAGTFEVSGNTLTIRPTVAKQPFAMAPGAFVEFSCTLEGDTLELGDSLRTEGGPLDGGENPFPRRWTRVR